jgi:hypothetical protein
LKTGRPAGINSIQLNKKQINKIKNILNILNIKNYSYPKSD